MSRRAEGQLFVGRLGKNARVRDLEEVFEPYGRIVRCDVKYGAEMAYAFVDFEDRRDADDALRYENGRDICGSRIIVEWAKGNPRRPVPFEECYRCNRPGHKARDCPGDRYGGSRRPNQGNRYRSPSPRRRRTSWRSRSHDRDRRKRSRSRSRSRERRDKDTREGSRGDSHSKRQRVSRSRSRSRSGSKSRSPSRSRSASIKDDNNHRDDERNSNADSPRGSRSRSPSNE